MFGIDFNEWLVLVLVAVVVIGPKDLPVALRTAGKWIAKMRRMSAHFQSGIEAMIREAELEEMEKKWREQNAAIMAQSAAAPAAEMATPTPVMPAVSTAETVEHPAASAEYGALNAEQAEQFHAHMPAQTAAEPIPSAAPAQSPAPEATH